MKKLLFVILYTSSLACFAMEKVNVDEHNFTCNQVKLTKNSTEQEITDNCNKVVVYHRQNGVRGRNPSRISGGGPDITQNTNPDKELRLDKIRFYDDEGQELICFFEKEKMDFCKVKFKERKEKENKEAKEASSQVK